MTEVKKEGGRVSLPTMVEFIRKSEAELDIKFDIYSKKVLDSKTFATLGEFNRITMGVRKGKIFISPLALITIRSRLEDKHDFSASDKVVRDALTVVYDELMKKYDPAKDLTSIPWWLTGAAK